ncbi:hypothetical protein YPPY54_1938, partial [Yersinia pestis PY-54]|jgi:hypothetical protein
MAPA